MDHDATTTTRGDGWRDLMRLGAGAAILVLVMIPLQAVIFIASPPPQTPLAYFELFQHNPLLGLLDLDLLLSLDYLAMIPFYLALYVVVRRSAAGWALLALVLGLFSLGLFLVSREATFSMWMLSDQYAAASSEADRAAITAAGRTLLTLYNGGTFATSYVLGAISTLLYSGTMWRHRVFGRWPGAVGLATGIMMLVPPTIGPIGVTIAMLSLIPTAVWLVLLARALLRTAAHGMPPVGSVP
jgi:Domain of unknown function (DUF4386)